MSSPGFCRDCLTDAGNGPRCVACGSPRLVRHPKVDSLSVAHVDCDAFYAAVEKRDNPDLRDVPVIIGGGTRGVVSTACYIARISGVRSAMPMFKARALCPQAVIIKPNMAKYVAVGREIRARMQQLTPLVEPLSIDEAFLDLTGTERLHGLSPARVLARFAAEVEREVGITVSVGLAANKFLAKTASELDKPRGYSVLGLEEAPAFLAPRPVTFIWGVGPAFGAKLARDGFHVIADLQRADEKDLARRYGAEGLRLYRLARGLDSRIVSPDREAKSVSTETTFNTDIRDLRPLEQTLYALCEKVCARMKAADLSGRSVTLKLKTADFRLRTRSRGLDNPTHLAARLYATAHELLLKEVDGTPFRLIGVGLSDLSPGSDADPVDLVDTSTQRLKATESAMDAVRAKFGAAALKRGILLDGPTRGKPERSGR
ncbi:DNA polymerase IV [Azorhizobium oxalatiphilum]|uniref:DNA polymerase IV n=1 Tax=Azorhizobium oxalatiphilum TaxID=980631 RepID=A0A917BU02_9HYPH|nr:DNA polymerase IV [Azorhizobium oxalatiphilum]GGF55840.1 DNA polymerase IV [Azorhizobium oxalatiphilum]